MDDALNDAQKLDAAAGTTAAPVSITVPAEHADLLQRAVALLEKGEQYVKDNIEAGVTMLEGLFKSDEENT